MSCPIVAASDIADGVIRFPDFKGRSPLVRFSPLLRMNPGLAGPLIVTESPCAVDSSTITIASAPSGIGAPVIMLQASPLPTSGTSVEPA